MFLGNVIPGLLKYVEERKKCEQILAKVVTFIGGNSNNDEYIYPTALKNIDVSRFAYFLVRVRTRQTGINSYEARKFTLLYYWTFNKDSSFVGTINGDSQAFTLLDTNSAPVYDIISEWTEVKSPTLNVGIRNNQTDAKEYEIDIVGIR